MNFDARKHILEYDDVLSKHRVTIYKKRKEILQKVEVKEVEAENSLRSHLLEMGAKLGAEVDLEKVHIGMRVEAVWKPREEWEYSFENIAWFRPIEKNDDYCVQLMKKWVESLCLALFNLLEIHSKSQAKT